ncbi:MAG: hypothetical protein ACYC2K_04440 [Gemmatimonadales bacterium]
MTLLAVAVVRIGVAALGTDRPAPGTVAGVDRPMVVPRARLVKSEFDSLVDVIRASAPFQSSRVPGAPAVADDPAVPRPARPILHLGGLVGGVAPLAVLYGIPGMQGGRVIQEGDTVGGLRVRSIRAGVVSVVGYDTTWALSLEETER